MQDKHKDNDNDQTLQNAEMVSSSDPDALIFG